MKRIGEVIHVKPGCLKEYAWHHAHPWPEVNAMIHECNIRNYSIFCHGETLFAYYEYIGEDFEADMAKMAADPVTQKWWDVVKPLMEPEDDCPEGGFWTGMSQLFYLE